VKKLYVPYIQPGWSRFRFKHPLYCLLGMRGVIAGHTPAEEVRLIKHSAGCRTLVEIGVAEGASALELRRVAHPDGTLHLIDPYESSWPVSASGLVARRVVAKSDNGRVRWIKDYSYNAAKGWDLPIEFLFIDGDHTYSACMQDWRDWSRFVVPGGTVAFHDGRIFEGGWTDAQTGSVRVVNELFRGAGNEAWTIVDEVDSLVVVRRTR
jgi:predicted O-methyltransferase YrrM